MIGDYRSHFVSLTFIVVSLRPRFSFALVFFDILITMIDIRRLVTCVGWRRRADLVTDLELGRLDHVLKCLRG